MREDDKYFTGKCEREKEVAVSKKRLQFQTRENQRTKQIRMGKEITQEQKRKQEFERTLGRFLF